MEFDVYELHTIEELLEVYELPIKVRKPTWSKDFYYRIDAVSGKRVSGSAFKGGLPYKHKGSDYISSTSERVYFYGWDGVKIKDKPNSIIPAEILELTEKESHIWIFFEGVWEKALFLKCYESNQQPVISVRIDGRYKNKYIDMVYSKDNVRIGDTPPDGFGPNEDVGNPNDQLEEAVLAEERRYLNKVLGSLAGEIDHYNDSLYAHKGKARETYYDWEDLKAKQYHIGEAETIRGHIAELKSFEYSPYFAHMEFDRLSTKPGEFEEVNIYIGKKGLFIKEPLVIDWRSDLGQTYYMKNMRDFSIKGVPHSLVLRRAIEIKNKQLISYNTEYDSSDVSLKGDIVDPFLLTVLRDKRRQRRLTDIISTIQGNQNSIISQPYKDSFVVQGCAGSGKTMILLHRLSFLLFNDKKLSRKNIKIITPNKYFNTFIDDLSEQLELHEVERLSVEEYYVRLIKAFSSKIKVSADVTSEMELPIEFLSMVYSTEFQEEVHSGYQSFYDDWKKKLPVLSIANILSKNGYPLPDLDIRKAEAIQTLQQELLSVRDKYTGILQKYENTKNRKKELELLSVKNRTSQQAELTQLQKETENVKTVLLDLQADRRAFVERERAAEKELSKEEYAFNEASEEAVAEVRKVEATLLAVQNKKNEYLQFDSFMVQTSDLATFIKTQNADIIGKIQQIRSDLQKVPVFNFTKRNSLRKKEDILIADFSKTTSLLFDEYIVQQRKRLLELKAQLPTNPEKIQEIKREKEIIQARILRAHDTLKAIDECLKAFSLTETPDVDKAVSKKCIHELNNYLAHYKASRASYFNTIKRAKEYEMGLATCIQQLEALQKELPTKEEVTDVADALGIIAEFDYSKVYRAVIEDRIERLFDAYSMKKENTEYRFMLYLQLLFCSMYFTKCYVYDSFINIDEAQDIALAEYKLLHAILGKNCVFNLYGDVNQLVYEYKGIYDWDDLEFITRQKIFVLNENYRNTMQITTFCNTEFGAEVYPIGISGDEVKKLHSKTALNWIRKHYKDGDGKRVAVLVGSSLRHDPDMEAIAEDNGLSWMRIDSNKPALVTVEMVKGLEFDAVLAVTDSMSENEKYIAFTRALDSLGVVPDLTF